MTPQSDQVSRQRAIEAALVELVACIEWVEFGRGMSRDEYRRREPLAWESARAALALPSETPTVVDDEPTAGPSMCSDQNPQIAGVAPVAGSRGHQNGDCSESSDSASSTTEVLWQCKDYADGWITFMSKRMAEIYAENTGCLMRALVVAPQPPSETPVGHQTERDGKESGAVGGDGWISVSERLPDEDVPVFALYPKGEIEFRVRGWDGDGWYWCNPYGSVHQTGDGRWESDAELDDDYAGVTHWMPLPQPPNAEREASTPSARSDIPQDPVFISELSAAGEKSGAVGGEGGGA